jgi:hypothetical protein
VFFRSNRACGGGYEDRKRGDQYSCRPKKIHDLMYLRRAEKRILNMRDDLKNPTSLKYQIDVFVGFEISF